MAKSYDLLRLKMSPGARCISEEKSQMIQAILETAEDMNKSGFMNDADYDKITMRHLGMKVKKET